MEQCKCGFLSHCAEDPNVPVRFEEHSRNYLLQLTPTITTKLSFCFFCGGKGTSEVSANCRCDVISSWIESPGSCIRREPKFGEIHLVYGTNKLILYYCPACGHSLPASRRSEYFRDPSPEELARFDQLLKNTNSIGQVVEILGQPDAIYEPRPHDEMERRIYGVKPIKQTLLFRRVAETFDVCAQEEDDGKLKVSFVKKPKNVS